MRASKSGTPVKVVILPLLASLSWKQLEIDWQFANRNCYMLSCVSWALAQISCITSDLLTKTFNGSRAEVLEKDLVDVCSSNWSFFAYNCMQFCIGGAIENFSLGNKSRESLQLSLNLSFPSLFFSHFSPFLPFYVRKQLLLSAHLGHRNSVCLFVCLSVRHTGGSVKNGAR